MLIFDGIASKGGNMKSSAVSIIFLSLLFTPFSIFSTNSFADIKTEEKVEMEIGINREHRDVGLKRLELVDKALDRELVERKRQLVHKIEQDYNKKVIELINSIIPAIFNNKVMTHLDVNFFAPEFESQIHASQTASVSIILTNEAFGTWAAQNSSEQDAMDKMKQLLTTTFKIPPENISILVVN